MIQVNLQIADKLTEKLPDLNSDISRLTNFVNSRKDHDVVFTLRDITVTQVISILKRIKKSKQFSWYPGGGGGYSIYPWVGRCSPAPHTLTLFKTNVTDFPTLFKTELRFLIPCLRHLKLRLQEVVWLSCCVINGNLMCLVSMPKSTEANIN